ncbi:hypothetical protein FA95DRAFT_1300596 [Auriscalpium vulgare]|uniref:Uncharacterized protein n=1 Tax=Auriscalpium vulgare TaxID=40419 RepID=A0ACB8RS43_9AGAM|nr:hypothetical protein FA95DRAFT_1300596 [Auriscalpium vulgare]
MLSAEVDNYEDMDIANQDGAEAVKIIESPDLWLASGNLIICTKSPQAITYYRVHKDILATHCEAFADLWGQPRHPPDSAFDLASEKPYGDGAPIMDFTMDAEEDVVAFLKAMYYPSETQKHPAEMAPYSLGTQYTFIPTSYVGVLRLSTKYVAVRIHNLVSQVFHAEWPSSLRQWDAHRRRYHAMVDMYAVREDGPDPEEYPMPVNAIRLARECNMPDISPCAYYDLYCASNESRLDAVLNQEEMQRLNLGQGEFQQRFVEALPLLFDVPRSKLLFSCNNRNLGQGQTCWPALEQWWEERLNSNAVVNDPIAFLGYSMVTLDAHVRIGKVCNQCSHVCKTQLNAKRTELWQALPAIFSLEDVSANWGSQNAEEYFFAG